MDPNAFRMLDVPGNDIRKANVSNLVRIFRRVAQQPEDAKQLRGESFISFKSYDTDPRPNWAIPQVRSFIQTLDKSLPAPGPVG
ncbi:MAG: hypothetical protein HY010_16555 [Acidobacteria bacterium]|nr:hypothetical protein [Acidobacteriota bacterium]